jgi:hypothetical protein
MKKEELNSQLKILIPNLEKFAYAMVPEESVALDLISDAYSVFLVKNADSIIKDEIEDLNSKELSFYRKKLSHHIMKEIYQLALKKGSMLKSEVNKVREFKSFYELDLRSRAFLILSHTFGYKDQALKSFFDCEAHDLIEYKHNATCGLLKDYQDTREVNV